MFGKKTWTKKQRHQSKSFFFSASIYHTTFMQCQIICQNNLLQSTKMPTIKGKKCADLVIDTLESMRNDEDFDSFFEVVQKAADPIKPVEKPTLPRQQKKRSLSPRNSSRLFKHLYFQLLTQSSVPLMIDLNSLH